MTAPLPRYRRRRFTDNQVLGAWIAVLAAPALAAGAGAAKLVDTLALDAATSEVIVVTETVTPAPTTIMTTTTAAGERARVVSPVRSSAQASRPRTTPPAVPTTTPAKAVPDVPRSRPSATSVPPSSTSAPASSTVHETSDPPVDVPPGDRVSGVSGPLAGTSPSGGTG